MVGDSRRRMSAEASVGFEEQLTLSLVALLVALWSLNFCRAISWTSMASAVGYWFVVDNAPNAPQARSGRCLGPAGCGLCRLLDSTLSEVSTPWQLARDKTSSLAASR